MNNILIAAVLSVSVLLAGCGGKERLTARSLEVYVPAELMECAGKPKVKSGTLTQRDVARFIAKLDAARQDCKGDLKALNKVVDLYNKHAKKLNAKKK